MSDREALLGVWAALCPSLSLYVEPLMLSTSECDYLEIRSLKRQLS
jgi:hypothetical protein